jgi:large subunit ribosomal protein L7/L12
MAEENKPTEENKEEVKEEVKPEATEEKKEEAKEDSSPEASAEGGEPKEEMSDELKALAEKHKDLIEKIEGMTVLELADLVKVLENKFGVSASAMAAAAPGGGGEGDEEEKSAYNVVLKDPGGSKINVIKAVKEITGVGLKEAKEFVDNAPKAIKEGLKKDEAEEIKKKLEEAGATVELE